MTELSILSHEEFMEKTGLSDEEMTAWLKRGLLVPAGRTAGKAALFSSSQLEIVQAIRSLLALGYDEDKVSRIARKVGLPDVGGTGRTVPDKLRTVGELAQACDVNPRTIKHWEDKELLEPDARSEGGFRLYGPAVVARCRRIIHLQNIGYSLEEIKASRGILDEPEAFAEAFRVDPRPEDIERVERESVGLKERIDRVRASAKQLEDLLKRRSKAVASSRSMLAKHQKSQKDQI